MIYIIPLLLGFVMNIISSIYVRNRAGKLLKDPYVPLPDIIHDTFPRIPILIPDYFLLFCFCLLIFRYTSLIHVEKNILCIGICTIIRSFSVVMTTMPTCMLKPEKPENIYIELFHSPHDLMFSGHSLFFIAFGNMMDIYFIKIVGPFLLIIARQHYTIDIFGSHLVYYFVYTNLE